jgi:hypothetical protein
MKNIHMFHPDGDEFLVFGKVRWETFDLVPYYIIHGHFADGVSGKFQEMEIGYMVKRGWYPETVKVPYDEQVYEGIKEALFAKDGDMLIERVGWYINGVPTPTPTATSTNTPEPTATNTATPTEVPTNTPEPTDTTEPVILEEPSNPVLGSPEWVEQLLENPVIAWIFRFLGLALVLGIGIFVAYVIRRNRVQPGVR